MGTVVPPSPSLSFLLLAGVIQVFEITTPGALILPLMGTVLCAYLPCRLEQAGRLRTDAVVERVEHALIDPACDVDALLKREIRTSLLSQTLRAAALYLLCFAGLCLALCSVRNMYDGLPDFVAVTAPVLLCAGSLGALLALRTRRAFAVFVLAVWLVLLAHRV